MPDPITINVAPAAALGVNLDQYVGLWAVDESRFMSLVGMVGALDLRSHIASHRTEDIARARAEVVEASQGQSVKLAVIDIEGALTKGGSSLSAAGSTVRIRQTLRQLASDPEIGGIMLRIDSPGGTVSGTADLAAEIASVAAKKPVHAFVEDCAASAAYWIASQASRIVANNRTAMVGSIGTFVGLYDLSAKAEKEGIRAVVVRSGEFKGAGFPGTPISDEQVAVWQALIDDTQSEFTAGVSRGRGMDRAAVEALADGRVHLAADAQALGLIDGIESFDAAMANLASAAMSPTTKGRSMAATTTETAATLKEIKAACAGADPQFVLSQLEIGATLDEARNAWVETLNARLEIREEELAKAKASKKVAGVAPLKLRRKAEDVPADEDEDEEDMPASEGEEDDEEAPAAFWKSVARHQKAGRPRSAAVSAAVRENPARHRAMLAAANRGRARRR